MSCWRRISSRSRVRRLGDRVKHFFTINELRSFVDAGYRGTEAQMGGGKTVHLGAPPELRLPVGEFNQVRHHTVLGREHRRGDAGDRRAEEPRIELHHRERPATSQPSCRGAGLSRATTTKGFTMSRRMLAAAVAVAALAAPAAASAAWTTPDDMSDAGADAGQQEVAIDAGGDSIATWNRWNGFNWVVQARTRSATGSLGFAPQLSDSNEDAFNPKVAVDAAGNATIVWSRYDGSNYRIQARTVSQFGVVGVNPITISDTGLDGSEPQVGIDGAGNAVITWIASDGVTDRIQARTLSPTGTLGGVLEVSTPGRNTWAPQLAVAPTGDTVLTWIEFDGANERIYANRLSAARCRSRPPARTATTHRSRSTPPATRDWCGSASTALTTAFRPARSRPRASAAW
jgi:hypothetical protein